MNRTFDNISVDIDEGSIRCRYTYPRYSQHEWGMNLLNDRIVYREWNLETTFLIMDIKEFQFEVEGVGRYDVDDRASAYIILKSDPDPQLLYTLVASQKIFALTSKTNAYDFCQQILALIGDKYAIPVTYKISIDTKAKTNRIGLIILVLLLVVIMWIAMFYFNK